MMSKLHYYRPVSVVGGRPASTIQDLWSTYSWKDFLSVVAERPNDVKGTVDRCSDAVVPVESFQFAPFASHTKNFTSKVIMVEAPVPKEYAPGINITWDRPAYWFAVVLKVYDMRAAFQTAGYRMLLRYVGLDEKHSKGYDFWLNIGSTNLKHIGYCSEDLDSRRMIVPVMVGRRLEDLDSYAFSQIHACHSIAFNWPDIQADKVHNCKFVVGNRVELLDTVHSMRVRPARIEKIVGHRVFVKLSLSDNVSQEPEENDEQVEGTWLEHDSPLLFYVGWSLKVGYGLSATDKYKEHAGRIAKALDQGIKPLPLHQLDADPDLFKTYEVEDGEGGELIDWVKGMRFEVLDPADTYKELRVGTVLKVLGDGYLKVGFQGDAEDEDHIPLHCTSPLLFPVGYAERYGLKLKGPGDKYVTCHSKMCGGRVAPDELFQSVKDYADELSSFKADYWSIRRLTVIETMLGPKVLTA